LFGSYKLNIFFGLSQRGLNTKNQAHSRLLFRKLSNRMVRRARTGDTVLTYIFT
jgi:hypothetical protein